MGYTNQQRQQLRQRCAMVLPGFQTLSPAAEYRALAEWCEAEAATADTYGQGGLMEAFENRIAGLLGLPAAVFMPSGVMAQLIAVRLYTEAAHLARFGMSPNSHLLEHEEQAFEALWGLHGVPLGSRLSPMLAADLEAAAQPLACCIVELPMREVGGQLPSWDELEALKCQARVSGVPLHLDGARLWQCADHFQHSFAEIVAGFSSVYVSMYKDIGGIAGSLLAGDQAFVDQARLWLRRMGGNLVQQTPFVASAMRRLDGRLALMPACLARARSLAARLAELPGVRVNPARPQTPMFHLHLDAPAEALNDARDALAESDGVWVMGSARPSEIAGWSIVEFNVGDNLLEREDASVLPLFERLLRAAAGR